ncbi:hypothetical protein QTN25_004535 [Entamoeba marina]
MKEIGSNSIPSDVVSLDENCFKNSNIRSIVISNNITSIGNGCFCSCFQLSNMVLSTNLYSLNNDCFKGCVSLTSIIIPSSIQSIGSCCFSNCSNLKKIDIPTSVTIIGNECFLGCYSLQSIQIPNTVKFIGSGCFFDCSSLQSILIPTPLEFLEKQTFGYCCSLTTIEFPSSLTLIDENCFYYCSSLTNIKLNNYLISIGDKCFSNCDNLKTILLPNTLKHIGKECFKRCGIQSITIPYSVQSLGVECFCQCASLTNLDLQYIDKEFTFQVSYDDSILYKIFRIKCTNIVLTSYDVKKLIEERKQENNEEKQFIVPNGVSEINDKVFSFQNLESIIIPTTVTSINNKCFMNCGTLTFISIPNNVKTIEMGSFEGCTSLKEISLPLNENNKYPFKTTYDDYLILNKFGIDCERIVFKHNGFKLKTKDIPKDIPLIFDAKATTNIKTIQKEYHFIKIQSFINNNNINHNSNNYLKLQSITIPTTIKYIGKHLIDGCASLTRLNYKGDWNDVVVSYDDHLRYKTNGLIFNNIEYTNDDSIKYGNVIPSIVHSLHYSCCINNFYSKLRKIIIPTTIKTIPKYCFSSCHLLTHVSLPTTLTTIKKKAFASCDSLTTINIPRNVEEIEEYTFEKCYSLTSIIFPTSITTFGIGCFKECYQLKGILNVPNRCF